LAKEQRPPFPQSPFELQSQGGGVNVSPQGVAALVQEFAPPQLAVPNRDDQRLGLAACRDRVREPVEFLFQHTELVIDIDDSVARWGHQSLDARVCTK
jgi:hypothetical protein